MNYKNEFINQYGIDGDTNNFANFVNDNWNAITGLSEDDKDEEQDFPAEVQSLMEELNIDYDEFSYSWSDVREGEY